jgi:hypothetical protein
MDAHGRVAKQEDYRRSQLLLSEYGQIELNELVTGVPHGTAEYRQSSLLLVSVDIY